MATQQSTVDYILDQAASPGNHLSARKMFGEYGLYCNEKIVGLICDDKLFLKITSVSDKFLDQSFAAPPYPGAKNYLKVPEEKWEDREWLSSFIQETTTVLPLPKPKKKKGA